jgi:hypothetical protein
VCRHDWLGGAVTFEARQYDASGRRASASFDTADEDADLRERRRGGTGDPRGGRTLMADWWVWWSATRQTVDVTQARALLDGG